MFFVLKLNIPLFPDTKYTSIFQLCLRNNLKASHYRVVTDKKLIIQGHFSPQKLMLVGLGSVALVHVPWGPTQLGTVSSCLFQCAEMEELKGDKGEVCTGSFSQHHNWTCGSSVVPDPLKKALVIEKQSQLLSRNCNTLLCVLFGPFFQLLFPFF